MTNRDGRTTGKRLVWDYDGLESMSTGELICLELTDMQVGFLLAIFGQAQWQTRWQNYSDWDTVLAFVESVQAALVAADQCQTPPPTTTKDSCPLPGCISVDKRGNEYFIEIKDCEMPVTINVYDGCGCGDGATASGSSSSTSNSFGGGSSDGGGGAGGSWIVEQDKPTSGELTYGVTTCDFITTALIDIIEQNAELVRAIDDNNESLSSAVNAAASAASVLPVIGDLAGGFTEWTATVLEFGSAAVLSMLLDVDYQYMVMRAWVQTFGGSGRIAAISRSDLLAIIPNMDNTWFQGNVVLFPKVIQDGLFRVTSINKANARLPIAQGTGNQQLCDYVFALAGEVYDVPPNPDDFLPPSEIYDVFDLAAWNNNNPPAGIPVGATYVTNVGWTGGNSIAHGASAQCQNSDFLLEGETVDLAFEGEMPEGNIAFVFIYWQINAGAEQSLAAVATVDNGRFRATIDDFVVPIGNDYIGFNITQGATFVGCTIDRIEITRVPT